MWTAIKLDYVVSTVDPIKLTMHFVQLKHLSLFDHVIYLDQLRPILKCVQLNCCSIDV